jgi:hypothetical protein
LHCPEITSEDVRKSEGIQKELALTPAKNVTTPNPFKIIPLQSTRKENSWETEEKLARAAVTHGDGTGQMVQPLMFMNIYICIYI